MTASILSLRDLHPGPAMGCIIEFEAVLASTLGAEIFIVQRNGSLLRPQSTQRAYPNTDCLFITAISFLRLRSALAVLEPRIRNGRAIYAYVFDSFGLKSRWPRGFSHMSPQLRPLRHVKHYFMPIHSLRQEVQDLLNRSVSYVPLGVDGVRFHSNRADRAVDVNAYGRQPSDLINHIADRWNHPNSSRFMHFTSHIQLGAVHDFERHRAHFWSLLARSKIALAYDPIDCNPGGRFVCSFVAQRWFESYAAGCVVAGSRPSSPEADDLLDWEDATIDLPLHVDEAAHVLEELLKDGDRIRRIGQRNVHACLMKHDWRYRIRDILRILNISPPQSLIEALNEASAAAQEVASLPPLPLRQQLT